MHSKGKLFNAYSKWFTMDSDCWCIWWAHWIYFLKSVFVNDVLSIFYFFNWFYVSAHLQKGLCIQFGLFALGCAVKTFCGGNQVDSVSGWLMLRPHLSPPLSCITYGIQDVTDLPNRMWSCYWELLRVAWLCLDQCRPRDKMSLFVSQISLMLWLIRS